MKTKKVKNLAFSVWYLEFGNQKSEVGCLKEINNKMPKAKYQNGITLIALIITVIILLILAGTAISVSVNGRDIFGKTSDAREQWNEAVAAENDELNKYDIGEFTNRKVYYKIDGTTLYLNNSKVDNSYKEAGNYFMSLNMRNGWSFPEWASQAEMNSDGTKTWHISPLEKVIVENVIQPDSTAAWFVRCTHLTEIENIENIDTRYTKDMHDMFYGCTGLTSLDLSTFNTSKVTDMSGMFIGCSNLVNVDVSNFDTSNVTNMASMFMSDSKIAALDVSKWNTGKVEKMPQLFTSCSSLTELDVSNWDTSNVQYMHIMFYGCRGLTELDVSKWNVSNVLDFDRTFVYCSGLTELDLSNWNTSSATNMNTMFAGCTNLTKLYLDNFDTSNVTTMAEMFHSLSNMETLDISSFDTRKVRNFSEMFNESSKLSTIYVGENWSTSANAGNTTAVFPSNCFLPNFSTSNESYRALRWAYVGEGGYLSTKTTEE